MTGNGQTSTKESLFTVTTARPQGKADNLIVLVHGCCTDANGVSDWHTLRNTIINSLKQRYGKKRDWKKDWEIVVWDWHPDSLSPVAPGLVPGPAYQNAPDQGDRLGKEIAKHPYKYVHLIGHSAGARLIDVAARKLAIAKVEKHKPEEWFFIHITFLDAYTPTPVDTETYGNLAEYPTYYSEHYVDKTFGGLVFTDANLDHAFNFDLTNWEDNKVSPLHELGHHWPRYWYTRSVEFPSKTGVLGFQLSLEGGNEKFCVLSEQLPPGDSCQLTNLASATLCGNIIPPATPCR